MHGTWPLGNCVYRAFEKNGVKWETVWKLEWATGVRLCFAHAERVGQTQWSARGGYTRDSWLVANGVAVKTGMQVVEYLPLDFCGFRHWQPAALARNTLELQ